jgi:hypothetical protein
MRSIHRGALLHRVAKLHKKTIVQISSDAGVDQSTFYYHKEQEDLPFEILYKYAVAMDYFFGTELPEFTAWLKDNNLLPNEGAKLSVEGLLKERDYWRDKYYALLEEHNNLIKDTYLKS